MHPDLNNSEDVDFHWIAAVSWDVYADIDHAFYVILDISLILQDEES